MSSDPVGRDTTLLCPGGFGNHPVKIDAVGRRGFETRRYEKQAHIGKNHVGTRHCRVRERMAFSSLRGSAPAPLKIICLIVLLSFFVALLPVTAAESDSLWEMSSEINSLSFDAQSQFMAMRRADDPLPFLDAAAEDISLIQDLYDAGFQAAIIKVNPTRDAVRAIASNLV